ncbi:hypothetical protein DINM_005255 [Dirofilaria immitis]|nr:hypothetical protein [Dirofilaria immitis]
MNELAFEKIIRVRSDDLAVLDESAYYETVYAGNSVPNRKFYAIESPFRMNSQGSLIFEKDSIANKNKLKRKRKYGICSNITCDLRDHSSKEGIKKAVAMDAFIKKEYEPISCSSLEASLDFNNCLARQSVLSASSVPCPLSRYAGQQSTAKQDIKEICLNEENRIIDDIPNELVMWVNAESKVMTAECKDGKRFDFILLDPPWENKSVKRKTVYTTYEDQSWMVDLYVPELWRNQDCSQHGLNSQHKQPFESIVFASSSTSRKYYMKIADEFVLISTPSAIHSRKPPLFPVLQALGILEKSATQLELYGRYLLSRTTTVGFEAAKLQNKRYFV